MSFNFKSVDTKEMSNEGVTFELKQIRAIPIFDSESGENPFTFYSNWLAAQKTATDKDGKPMTVTLYGSNAEIVENVRKKLTDDALKALPPKRREVKHIPEDIAESIEEKILQTAIKDWYIIYEGDTPLKVTQENKKVILDNNILREQVIIYRSHQENFMPKQGKN